MNSHSLDLVSSFVFAFELSVFLWFFIFILLLPALSLILLKKTNKQTQAAAIEFNLEFFFK